MIIIDVKARDKKEPNASSKLPNNSAKIFVGTQLPSKTPLPALRKASHTFY